MDGKESLKTLAVILERDHESMNRLLEDVIHHCQHGATALAAQAFDSFQRLITQHMRSEERVLSELELEGRCPRSLAQRVIYGHLQLDFLIAHAAVAIDRPDQLAAAFTNLVRALLAHERLEEDEVMPVLCARSPAGAPALDRRHAAD